MQERRVSYGLAADALQWAAYTLILVFLAQVLTAAFPVALIQPQWILRTSAALRTTASLPLLATALLLLANMIDETVMPSSRQLNFIRRIATAVALGFLLLIPVQSWATVRNLNSQVQEASGQLKQLQKAADLMQKASTEQQLRQAILAIPGGEQLANRPLGADVQTVKTGLLARIRAGGNRLENQLKDNRSKALQNLLIPLIRDGVICLAFALGFASMGYNKVEKPTPLRRILKARSQALQKEMGSNWPGLPGMFRRSRSTKEKTG